MAQQLNHQFKRRFEVNLASSQKRPRPNECEPQQNPLQARLVKRKTAPGLEALLSEARTEPIPINSGALDVPSVNEGSFGNQSFHGEQSVPLVSSKPQVKEGVKVATFLGSEVLKGGGSGGQGNQETGLEVNRRGNEMEVNGLRAGKPPKKKKHRSRPMGALTQGQQMMKDAGKLLKPLSLTREKRKAFFLEEKKKGGGSSKLSAKGGQAGARLSPLKPQTFSQSKPQNPSTNQVHTKFQVPRPSNVSPPTSQRPRKTDDTQRGRANGKNGVADLSTRSAQGNGEMPLPSGGVSVDNPGANPLFKSGLLGPLLLQGQTQGEIRFNPKPSSSNSKSQGTQSGLKSRFQGGFANGLAPEARSFEGSAGEGKSTMNGPEQRGQVTAPWQVSSVSGPEQGRGVNKPEELRGVNGLHGKWGEDGQGLSGHKQRGGRIGPQQGGVNEPEQRGGVNEPQQGGGVNSFEQEVRLSLQAQECQRLWEALQRSMQNWQGILLQREREASQESAKLDHKKAAAQKVQNTATEQLGVARKLKQAAEEICESAVLERRRAMAELKEARDERASIERAKQELETRREELATEAMELDQKRRLYEETLVRLEAEKAAAEERNQNHVSTNSPLPFSGGPVAPTADPPNASLPNKTANPGDARSAAANGPHADASSRQVDVSEPRAHVSNSAAPRLDPAGRGRLTVVGGLMREREGSGSPSPLGLYRRFGSRGVKVEVVDLSPDGGGVDGLSEGGVPNGGLLRGDGEGSSLKGGLNGLSVKEDKRMFDTEMGGAASIKGEEGRENALSGATRKEDETSDASVSDEDLPLSFRTGLRKQARFAERGTDSPSVQEDGVESRDRIRQSSGGDSDQEAARLLSDIKAELTGGGWPNVESVSERQGVEPNRGPSSTAGPSDLGSPGLGPLGWYPPPKPNHSSNPSMKLARGGPGDTKPRRELIHIANGGEGAGLVKKKERRKRTAVEVLQKDAPELLESLSQAGMLDGMKLFGDDYEGDEEAAGSASFRALQAVLNKIYDATPSRNGSSWISSGISGAAHLPKYCMGALKVLTDEARRLRRGGKPVEWGWCHKLHAFLFVFEEQNRFVLEWPHYGNATYFFNLESRDVEFQLRRLIAVMSIGTVTKNDIVEDRPLELIKGIPSDELRILEEFGRKRETGLGSFLNFANRVVHDYKDESTLEQWQAQIRGELHRGGQTGQIDKSPLRIPWSGLGEIAPLRLGGGVPVTEEELLAVKEEQMDELGPLLRM